MSLRPTLLSMGRFLQLAGAQLTCEVNAKKVTLTGGEIGGQMAVAPPQRKGFGSRLIDAATRQLPAGRVTKDFNLQGLQVVVQFEGWTSGTSRRRD